MPVCACPAIVFYFLNASILLHGMSKRSLFPATAVSAEDPTYLTVSYRTRSNKPHDCCAIIINDSVTIINDSETA